MADKKIIAVVGATGAQGGGLVRSILADRGSEFSVRAITRKPDSDKGKALAAAGAEIVAGDADIPASLDAAFAGAHGVFVVTNFWEHFSAERELAQATAMARATRRAGAAHVVWSTLEDTRKWIPLSDPRVPNLHGKYKVAHFDVKGEADAVFAAEAAPTSYLVTSFYWDNFIHFGMGPRRGEDGKLGIALALGGVALPGIAVADIGACAHGVFKRGPGVTGQRFGICGEVLTGDQMAAGLARHLGEPVSFTDVPFEVYRNLGFPGAEDLSNMFQVQSLFWQEFLANRDVALARALHPGLQNFDTWLSHNIRQIPLG
ncbi:MAG: NmrA family NAD(P)-binding protein [Thermoanaerobaculia bacterium]